MLLPDKMFRIWTRRVFEGKSVAVYVKSATRVVCLRRATCLDARATCLARHARQVSTGNANSYLILRLLNPTATTWFWQYRRQFQWQWLHLWQKRSHYQSGIKRCGKNQIIILCLLDRVNHLGFPIPVTFVTERTPTAMAIQIAIQMTIQIAIQMTIMAIMATVILNISFKGNIQHQWKH